MRKAINENRVVQIAVLGVLAVAAAVFLMTSMNGGSGSSAQQASSASSPATTTPPAASGPSQAAAGSASPSGATSAQTSADTSAPAAAPVPLSAPGLAVPQDLLASYDHNRIVVLLIVRAGGIDDGMVKGAANQLQSHPEVALYVTRARGIARYAAITQGLDVNRVPALVVIEPKVLSNGTPTARVTYGFRSAASVVQAVRDGVLGGPKVP